MPTRLSMLVLVFAATIVRADESKPKVLVRGLPNPTAVCVGLDRRVYVAVMGEAGKAGDGAILVVADGRATPFAQGLDDPSAIVPFAGNFFVVDQNRIWRVDGGGKASEWASAKAFPAPPQFLNDIAVDEQGHLYVTDSGQRPNAGAIYRIRGKNKVERVAASTLKSPHGIAMDGMSHLLVSDEAGNLYRLKIADGGLTKLANGGLIGPTWDWRGRLYVSTADGRILVQPRPDQNIVELAKGLGEIGGLCARPDGSSLLVVDGKAGALFEVSTQVPGQALDETPMPLATEIAFPKLKWTGWEPLDKAGRPFPLRPILLTHAGDGSGRVFVPTQHGVIHVFPNDQNATQTKIFLDLHDKVRYNDNSNEEGFLGLAFHPRYKTNGEFFVFYTDKNAKLTNVVSRFRVSKDDPDKADPASEEELLRIEHRYWNHDGGTIVFGPDGYLYIAVGDGGSANDPERNGQNLGTVLGKILRIDTDHKAGGKSYAIPPDNPFAGQAGARPEVYAYGLRNVWRMAFDRTNGRLWAGDVGQNLYEEIDFIERGKNYGWNIREGLHPFGAQGVGPRPDLVEPIWEYHHDIGKSITGGAVYRGTQFPELAGAYLYADYVSLKIWALWYDEKQKRVVANRPIRDPQVPILSFGEDDRGELYFMTYTTTGQGIYRFARGR